MVDYAALIHPTPPAAFQFFCTVPKRQLAVLDTPIDEAITDPGEVRDRMQIVRDFEPLAVSASRRMLPLPMTLCYPPAAASRAPSWTSTAT